MFTKEHYEAIAEIVNKHIEIAFSPEDIEDIVYDLADYFEIDNPNFNREKFLDACGVN